MDYKKRIVKEYREIVSRTPPVGDMKNDNFATTLYTVLFSRTV